MTDRPPISPDEMQRRRKHVETAIADSRLEGMETGDEERAIFEAYIRGEIEAGDLVTEYQRRNRLNNAATSSRKGRNFP